MILSSSRAFGKIICALGVLTIAFCLVPAIRAHASVAEVSGDIVNVRVAPSTDSQIMDKLIQGQRVDVLELNGDWLKVSTPAYDAVYVNKEFMTVVVADAIVNDTNVNVRAGASTQSEILGQLDVGGKLKLTERVGDFYAFSYDGKTAYIHQDFVVTSFGRLLPLRDVPKAQTAAKAETQPAAPVYAPVETTYAQVLSENGMNLRSEPSADAPVLAVLSFGEAADLVQDSSEWKQVSYLGTTGYLNAEFVVVKTGVKPENSIRTSIVNFAKQHLGTRYVWGGTNLKTGVDCSGFTSAVFRAFGINLYRSSGEQVSNGRRVTQNELVAGDLVFFGVSGSGHIGHVGIYIGGGQFIHASSSGSTPYVTINSLSDAYYSRNYITACRVLN